MKLYTMDVKSRFDFFFLQTYEVEEKCTCTMKSGGAAVPTCCYSDTSWSLQRIKLLKNCSSLFKTIHS